MSRTEAQAAPIPESAVPAMRNADAVRAEIESNSAELRAADVNARRAHRQVDNFAEDRLRLENVRSGLLRELRQLDPGGAMPSPNPTQSEGPARTRDAIQADLDRATRNLQDANIRESTQGGGAGRRERRAECQAAVDALKLELYALPSTEGAHA